MNRFFRWLGVGVLAGLTGCAAVAPNYTPSPQTTQRLQAEKVQPVTVGDFSAAKDAGDSSITLRASSMQAAQGSYAKYLADAIKQELEIAKLYTPSANIQILGILLRNDMNTGLADKGEGVMEARFIVRRDAVDTFDKVKTARTQWDSNFLGAIAIARAQQEYPRLVHALVAELFSDPEFVAALK